MSLDKEIYDAYVASMGGESQMDELAKKSMKDLSVKLSNAFINFLTKQEFRIVEQELPIKIDSIKTTNSIIGSLTEEATVEGVPVDKLENVVVIPNLDLKSSSGQGGSLEAKGSVKHKQSNYKSANVPSPEAKKSVVKLFKGEIK